MRKSIIIAFFMFAAAFTVSAQTARTLPLADLRDLKGKTIPSNTIASTTGPTIISFWATWCKPCIQELNNINEVYEEWQKETGVKVIAISVDDSRNAAKVGPLVTGKGWTYDTYIDLNGDFKRLMNVNNVPHTFLLNAKGEIIWQHNSYSPGDEDELFELVKKTAALSKEQAK
ncbi:MAG: TlpA disulfide reductase family protein [Bacteroidota bacterium]